MCEFVLDRQPAVADPAVATETRPRPGSAAPDGVEA
jgi:hypothetical protein